MLDDGLGALTSGFDAEQWRALGVLACEQRITASMLDRLGFAIETRPWLRDCVTRGLLVDAGVVYGSAYHPSISSERAVAITSGVRPLVLRHLATSGALSHLTHDVRTATGNGSLAGFTASLYAGDVQALRAALAVLLRQSVRDEAAVLVRTRLREALCSPFDPETITRVWGSDCSSLVDQALMDAAVTFEPVDELYHWALSRNDTSTKPSTLRILAEHALLRGDLATLGELRARLPTADVPPIRAAESFLRGDLEEAQHLLDVLATVKSTRSQRPLPCPASVTAILVVSALSRGQPAGALWAKRLLQRLSVPELPALPGWPAVNAQLALVRATRVLIRYLTQPEDDRPRLSPHHLASDTPGWQTLTTALTVLVADSDTTTRLAWTRRLLDDATRWKQGNYTWLVHQTRHLARSLSVDPVDELESLGPCRSDELLLSLLLEREPEWRIALRAVDKILHSVEREQATLSRRVCWDLDMTHGDFNKPMLEEYRSDVGWMQARRVDFEALRSMRDALPPEDQAVLLAIDAAPRRGRSPHEAIEALCGHPRVFNGARGRQAVEVVRGNCYVETSRERGHLVIRVEPAGATEGVHVVVESETRAVVYRVNAAVARLIHATPDGLRIPEAHEQQGRALLTRLAEHLEIRGPELGASRVATADSTPCLRISPEAGAWWVEVGVRPFGEFGRFFPPGLGRSVVTMHADHEWFDTARNTNQEIARYHALLTQCPTLLEATRGELETVDAPNEHPHSFSLGEEQIYALLTELRNSTEICNIEWKSGTAIRARGTLTSAALHGSLRRIKGWYLVNGSIRLDDVSSIDLAALIRMPFTKSGRFIRMPSGDFLEVERRIRQVLSGLACAAQLPPRGSNGDLRFPEAAIDTLQTLMNSASALAVDDSVSKYAASIEQVLSTEPALPAGLKATLRPYQLEGYHWLHRNSQLGFGVCLADDMGLGKTLQVIALLLTRAESGPALVVAPTSVCSNWIDELRRFAPALEVAEYTGRARAKLLAPLRNPSDMKPLDVLVVSYALMQQDAAELASIEWNTAVIDEAQFIKNPNSLRAKAVFRLSARQRVAMTGTPVENHLTDLWSIFHFLHPTLLGSLRHFHLTYVRPIERDHSQEQQALLQRLIRPFLLRRRKDEVLRDLPPTTTVRHEVRLSEDETLRYALLRRQIHDKLSTPHGKRQHKLQILAEITRLRRFCCHPRLVFPDASSESSKLQTFLDLVEELRENGHRALVFSQFVDFLELVREQLDERGFKYAYLDGSTPKQARGAQVRAFQEGGSELFLISLKAGGFGLNLTAADYVIHLDPWWNPAVEAQATDRAHRIGQQRPVTVYRLVTKDSIEERIIELHQQKRALADALLNDADGTAGISSEELLALLEIAD